MPCFIIANECALSPNRGNNKIKVGFACAHISAARDWLAWYAAQDTFSGQISVATTYFHYLTAPVMATVSLNQSDC